MFSTRTAPQLEPPEETEILYKRKTVTPSSTKAPKQKDIEIDERLHRLGKRAIIGRYSNVDFINSFT